MKLNDPHLLLGVFAINVLKSKLELHDIFVERSFIYTQQGISEPQISFQIFPAGQTESKKKVHYIYEYNDAF